MRSTRSSPCSSTGEVRNRSTIRFGLPVRLARRVLAQDPHVLARGLVALVGVEPRLRRLVQLEVRRVDDHVRLLQLAELQQLRIREGRLRRPAAAEDHDLLDGVGGQQVDRVVGGVGLAQLVGAQREHPRAVDRDVAVADDDDPLAVAEVELAVGVVGMAVVPAHEGGGRLGSRQVLAGDAELPVGRRADRVDHRVVALEQVGAMQVAARARRRRRSGSPPSPRSSRRRARPT